MTIPDRMLRQYLAGALEPPDSERVERALKRAPALRDRLATLVDTTIPAHSSRWVVPPPSLRSGMRATAAPAAVMESGSAAGWLVLRMQIPAEQLDHVVLVLERVGAEWEVVFPSMAEEMVTASALPRIGDAVQLDLAAGQHRRVAVVFIPPDHSIDFTLGVAQRWSEVKDSMSAGKLPVVSLDTPKEM